jgi:uncharacterized protein
MRVLYDTNVLVGKLSRREAILALKEEIANNTITHITSKHILSEVEAVLVEKFKRTKQKAKAATRLLERQSTVVSPKNIERVCRDPFDDYILAAAVAGKVKYLVTADNDLLVLKEHRGIKIVTPAGFARILRK